MIKLFVTHLFHNCCTPYVGLSHQYQVSLLLCFERLIPKADNVMYTNAHIFCWLHKDLQLSSFADDHSVRREFSAINQTDAYNTVKSLETYAYHQEVD